MSRKSSRERNRVYRAKQRDKKKSTKRTAAWRPKSPTKAQHSKLKALGLPAMPTANRGEVGDRIRKADPNPKEPRKGKRRRADSASSTSSTTTSTPTAKRRPITDFNPAASWKFGVGQSKAENLAEIDKAMRQGLGEVYADIQNRTLASYRQAYPLRPAPAKRKGSASKDVATAATPLNAPDLAEPPTAQQIGREMLERLRDSRGAPSTQSSPAPD